MDVDETVRYILNACKGLDIAEINYENVAEEIKREKKEAAN